MGYKTTADPSDGAAVGITMNDADESYVYSTVIVRPSTGFERNAVEIITDADASQADLDTSGTGMMRDDTARALSAALALHYATKDGVVVGGRPASDVTVERVRAYADRCAVLRQEPSTEGLRRALDGER